MKYCIAIGKNTSMFTPLLLAGNVTANLITAGEMGFDGVEIQGFDAEELDFDQIKQVCREHSLIISTLGTGGIYGKYGLSLTDPDEERSSRVIQLVKDYIDVAKKLGSCVTVGSIKGNIKKDEDRPVYLDILGRNLQKIASYAEKQKVTLLLEATNRLENNVLNTAKETREIIERYELKNTKILLDSFHVNIEEQDISKSISDAGEHLGYVHFGDNNRWYPGAGCFRFHEFNEAIVRSGYDGVLSAECFPRPDGLTAAKRTYEFFVSHFG